MSAEAVHGVMKWASLGAKTVEQREYPKYWLGKGWLDQSNIDLPLEEGRAKAKQRLNMCLRLCSTR